MAGNEEVGALRINLDLQAADFSKSMSEISRKLKGLKSEFNALSAGNKDFENSLEGLRAKQTQLAGTFDLQRQRVTQLKREYDRLVETNGKNSAEAEKMLIRYNNSLAAMRRTESQLAQVNQKISEQSNRWNQLSLKMDGLKSKFSQIGSSMTEVGKKMSATVTTAIAGIGLGAVKMANDAMSAQGRIQAGLGDTAKEAKALSKVAINLWKNGFGENVTEAADTVTLVKQQLKGLSGKEIEKVSEAALGLQKRFGYDVSESVRSAKALIDNFGVSGTQAMNYIAVATQKGGDYSGELLDTISEYSVQFKAAGMDIDNMFNILINGAKDGAFNMDKIGDSVKEFQLRATDGSKTTAQGFAMIGLDAQKMGEAMASGGDEAQKAFMATVAALANMKDPLKQNQAGVALFGTQWEDVKNKVITSMNPTKNAIGDVTGATDKMNKAMNNNPGAMLTKAWRSLQASLLPLGTELAKVAVKIMPSVQNAVNKASNAFSKMPEGMKQFIVISAGIAAVIGPITVGLGMFIGAFANVFGAVSKVISVVKNLQSVFTLLRVAFTAFTGPVGIAVAAIALIGVALVTAYNHSKTFRDFVNGIPGAIKGVWQSVSNFFTSTLPKWGSNILNATQNAFNTIIAFLKKWGTIALTVVTNPVGLIVTAVAKHWDTIKSTTSSVFNAVKSFLSNLWNGIKSIVGNAVTGIKNGAINGWNAIKSTTTSIFNAVKTFLVNLWNGIKTSISNTATGIKNGVVNVWNSLKSNTVSLFNSIKSFLSSLWNGIKSNSVNAVENIKNGVVNGWNTLKSKTTSLFSSIKSTITNTFNDIVSGAKNLPGKIANGIRNGASAVTGAVKWLANKTVQSAGNLVNGVIDGVNWVLGKVGVDKKLKKWDIPQYAKGTGGHPGGPMVVGDGGQEELVILPNGETYISPDTSTLVTAPAGTQVLNGEQTKQLMNFGIPFYAGGTLSGIWDKIKSVGNTIKDKALEVWDYIDNPKKLLDKVLDKLGISVPSGGGGIGDVLRGSLTFIKDKVIGFLKKQLDFGGGNPPGTGVQRWRPYVIRALAMNGLSTSESMIQKVLRQIATESGGNPLAVQHGYTDINTIRGDLAKGLMQTISATFNAYKFPGHGNIFNGFDNLLAALNYAKHRYGPSLSALGKGHGYAEGAFGIDVPQLAWLAEGGWPESVISLDPKLKDRSAKIWYQTGQALGLISPAGLDDKGTDGLMTTFNGLSNTLSKLNQAIENQNSNNPIQVILHYNGTGSEQDAYHMVDIVERELGNRMNTRLRMSGVRA